MRAEAVNQRASTAAQAAVEAAVQARLESEAAKKGEVEARLSRVGYDLASVMEIDPTLTFPGVKPTEEPQAPYVDFVLLDGSIVSHSIYPLGWMLGIDPSTSRLILEVDGKLALGPLAPTVSPSALLCGRIVQAVDGFRPVELACVASIPDSPSR
ncbi:MAG: hypothetical protein ABIH78_03525 [Candidatus Peregrinibacteria bacterium]